MTLCSGRINFPALPLLSDRPSDLPVVPERIDDAPHPPAVSLAHRPNLRRTSRYRPRERRIRIRHSKNESHRTPANRLGTEVPMLGRFVAHPKLCAIHGKPCHHAFLAAIQPIHLCRSERRFVELHSSRAAPHRQPRRNRATQRTHCPIPR